jgi:septal ring factor EnvC (AmiA/AmiB activator)
MNTDLSRKIALGLIVCALVGTEVSDRFRLEFRFEAIEQKVEQNNLSLQKFQASLEDLTSSKTETLAALGKKVDALQASYAPLGQATKQQTDSVTELHQEIISLQQAQAAELEAEKNLSRSISEAEKARKEQPAPAAKVSEATILPLPSSSPAPVVAYAPDKAVSSLVRPASGSEENATLRTDDKNDDISTPGLMAEKSTHHSSETTSEFHSVRALPVVPAEAMTQP